ncbi:GyrI-like domain-containing protein [Flavobacterium paronense]|uniref:GyrI-like domain-containing protein n=1 Tax=Flavobacterium paronense TaxID=1392775 RepID=A0ABV5GHR6_9FLAO|nr:GyrI-like domain-containing protein [Flavobacterium paronense]MDN3677040.1 GyrI-like domain-containing protein [Flavobacterium paronense]
MRILKYIFLLILLALVGITVYVATQKGVFQVSKSSIIKAQRSTVFDYVNDYKNWETFGSWMQKDANIKFNYDAKTIGNGAKFSFVNGSDEGNIKTVYIKESDSLLQKVNFNGTTATISWKFKDTLGGTKVTVYSKGKMDILTKISTFFKGGIVLLLEDVFEKNLRNLNKTLNYEMKTYSIKVNGIVQRPSGFCLKQTVSCHIKSVGKNTKILMARMIHFFKKNKIPMAGKPFVNYDRYDVAHDFATISICIPVRQQISISDGSDVTSEEIIAFTCLKTSLIGDYSHTKEAWAKAKKYITDNGLKENFAGSYTEVYIKTIDDIKQPSKWITEIYIPVFPKQTALPKLTVASVNPVIETPKTTTSSTETP